MNTDASAATAPGIDEALLADLDRAAGAPGDTFSRADLPAAVAQPGAAPGAAGDQAVAGMIAGALVVTFSLLAKKRGAHWALDADAAKEAGDAYAAVIQKYFPAFQGGPEFAAVMITVAVITPRVMVDKAEAAAREAERGGDGAIPE